ncbi:MAG: CDP-alcohol phosphatidyltransferase family protein [Bryobacteraceae bacterium]
MRTALRQIPNLLTLARIALVPFVGIYIWKREYIYAAALFAIAGFTDALDGWLARKMNASSRFGLLADPIADKLLLSTMFVVLAVDRVLPWWFSGLVLGRDVLILLMAVAGLLFTRHRGFPPTIWGKLSTLAQILYLLVMLLNRGGLDAQGVEIDIEKGLYWTVIALTAFSGLHYMWTALRLLRTPALAET